MAERGDREKTASPLLMMGEDLRESIRLRWQLAQIELQSDARSAKRLAVATGVVAAMVLTALPVLVVCLAELLDGRLGIADIGWLAIFGFGLLTAGCAAGWFAWRRFRRRFVGLQQTLEELREDLVWLKEELQPRNWDGEKVKKEDGATMNDGP